MLVVPHMDFQFDQCCQSKPDVKYQVTGWVFPPVQSANYGNPDRYAEAITTIGFDRERVFMAH